ncbi:MAG: sigma 54-interacting transcriptional regulator [Sandaracinaceae bacterium]
MGWRQRRWKPTRALGPHAWEAQDRLSGRPVVLKRASPEQLGTLEREHALGRRIRHPVFRRLLGALRDDGGWLVLEHVAGRAPRAGDDVAVPLLRALLHLHDRGWAHGDLKPDNLIVEGDRLRVIDLGLAARIGGPAAGGTHGFLAPELLRGEPVSVASDLYALGRTLQALGARGTLADLAARACAPSPDARPASAAAALAALGALPRPADRAGELPWRGADVVARAVSSLGSGRTLVISAPPGAGRSRVARELGLEVTGEWRPLATASLASPGALARLAGLYGADSGSLDARLASAAPQLAAESVTIVLDDADRASDDARAGIVALARGLAVTGAGSLAVIGSDEALTSRLEAAGAEATAIPPLSSEDVRGLLEDAGARASRSLVDALREASAGRAGVVASLAAALADDPRRSDAEVVAEARQRLAPRPSEIPRDARAAAIAALDAGEGRRALALLDTLDDPTEADLVQRASALELIGQLADALDVLSTLAPAHGNWRARLAAKLGRYEDALRLAADDEEGCALAASAALSLGRLDEVEARVRRGEEIGEAARFASIRSDASLRAGDAAAAAAHAQVARDAAQTPRQIAEAESRLGSALSLGREPERARAHHVAALEAAEAAGEPSMLPAYIVNVATAHHALGELGAAMARYEEAARLSERLGRTAMAAVALTNLAGLLVSVGARAEAEAVLGAAREAAEASGAAIYRSQCALIDAERLADGDRARAEALARDAASGFEACGASRQVLEARLLLAELSGDPEAMAGQGEALRASGLEARFALLQAEVARREGALDAALSSSLRAAESADSTLRARALSLAAEVARRRGDPDAAARAAAAREAAEEVASALPPGLRERYLAGAPEPPSPTPEPASRRLGEGGRRLLSLVRRVLLEGDERRVLEAAVDEAVASTRAERAFLLRPQDAGEEVLVARNLDRDTIRSGRFSRSVAERVLASGEPVLTEMATADPSLAGARSVADLGLRSILCVPIRSPGRVVGALYLDHRFETARFDGEDLELVGAIGDVIGMALENARLHREARARAGALERVNEEIREENVRAAMRLERLEQRLAADERGEGEAEAGIVGTSRPIRRAIGVARRVAPSDLSVLVEGESGTGKELFARFVHAESHRSDGPFLAVNCGALPENLLESELFGHVRGAFTGAHRDHPGLFRSARGGTVFLDEVGDMPPRMQTRLLRVLQEREVRAVGAEREEPVDVRVVAATNRDLAAAVEEGAFREDLFYRLVGVRVALPPLRERQSDIPLLAAHGLERIASEPGMRAVTLSKAALATLLLHPWPGNVRELWQTLRRAVLVAEGDALEPEDLALGVDGALDRRAALRRFDRRLVEEALRAADGNRTAAARALGVSRMTIHRWIKRYDLG